VFDLTGKVAVVTGGGRGIGRGIVRAMARAGADVVAAGRTAGPLEESVAEARSLGARAIAVPTDITDLDDVARLVERSLAEFGAIDCWVNNAGSARAEDVGPLIDLTEDQWDAVVDLNLKWTFFAAQAAVRAMERGGSIINISSRSGSQPNPMTGHYGASKAGIENLTATMAVEWGHRGIRVNAVAPGVVEVESSIISRPSRRQRQIDTVPLRRLGTVDDVGPLCVYLASDEASWVTGDVIQVHGGSRIPVGYLTYLHHVSTRLAAEAAASAETDSSSADGVD
jgi:NAD(P)-dependent dehydrogenase (short-subunit alcohol dehydrogenase family)